jgi:hypothetical protein
VDRFASLLKEKGFPIWLDEWSLKVGETFWEKIGEAIETCDFVILILSGNSIKSKGVLEEIRAAHLLNLDKVKILPIRIDPIGFSEIPPYLRSRHVLDFVGWQEDNRVVEKTDKLVSDILALSGAFIEIGLTFKEENSGKNTKRERAKAGSWKK